MNSEDDLGLNVIVFNDVPSFPALSGISDERFGFENDFVVCMGNGTTKMVGRTYFSMRLRT